MQPWQDTYRDSFKPLRIYFAELLGDLYGVEGTPPEVKTFMAWRRTHRITTDEQGRTVVHDSAVTKHTVARDFRPQPVQRDPSASCERPQQRAQRRQPTSFGAAGSRLVESCRQTTSKPHDPQCGLLPGTL